MTSFKKTRVLKNTNATNRSSRDAQYWKKYEFPITVKEFTSIDCIDISPIEPFYIAISTGPKVDIYHQQSAQVWKSLTRFQKCAYGGKFRRDGQLLIAGSEESQVKLFNFKQNQLLRTFKGHKGPVHRADFVYGKSQIVTFSDDKSVRLWDLADEKEVMRLEEHKDFIRAGASSHTSEHIVVSGSFDHSVKIWDSRTRSSVMTLNQGAPVQDVLCYPCGSVIASAGGTEVKIWDIVGGKVLSVLSHHHKTITCLSLATNNTRLLSGSLDRHVKVYDLNTYSPLHSLDYPAPVMSIGIAPKDSTIVTGMLSGGSGLLSFEQRTTPESRVEGRKAVNVKKRPNPKLSDFNIKEGDEFFKETSKAKLATYDKMLSRFEFSKAFDNALNGFAVYKSPEVTVAVLRELIRRDGLATAMAGRDAKSLAPLHRFLVKNIRNANYHGVLIEVANTLLDIYGDSVSQDPKLLAQLTRLNEEISKEFEGKKFLLKRDDEGRLLYDGIILHFNASFKLQMDLAVSHSGISLMGAIEMFVGASSEPDNDQNLALDSVKHISSSSPRRNISTLSQEVVVDIL